jgi:TetR/AcrR family transcriptional regulator, cholesterol catabolism regulator
MAAPKKTRKKRDRSDHWAQRREEILRCGARLFAAQGFDRTSVQDIMDEFESTAAAFYYYYGDKNELLTEMLDRFLARAEKRLRWLDDHPLPDWAKLRMMIAEHTSTIAGDPAMAAVLFEELQTLPEPVRAQTYTRMTAYTGRLEQIFAAGVAAGDFAPLDPEVAVPLVLGMSNHSYRWFRPSAALSAEDLGALVADMAMRALGVRANGSGVAEGELDAPAADAPARLPAG